jgi:RNA-binding protein
VSELAGFQRRALRAQAHSLRPVVQIGQGGITPGVLHSLNEALAAQELLKVRFVAFQDRRKAIAAELAAAAKCELVGLIGSVGIYYRAHPDPAARRVLLPTR